MKNVIEIDLQQPFDHVLETVLALPPGGANSPNRITGMRLHALVRHIYEAANGRQLESAAGLVPIARPIAEFLKAKPFKVTSQKDFLIATITRIICGSSRLTKGTSLEEDGQLSSI